MATTVAQLVATLGLDSSEFNKGLDTAEKKSSGFSSALSGLSKVGGGILTAGLGAATTGAFLLGKELFNDVQMAMDAQKVEAQLNAVLKSTGGIAGVTTEAAKDLADSLSTVTTFEDDAILAGENMLLTFTNIGKDVFPLATETILDMSTALGQDLQSSAVQLGKAINSPIEGLTALTRVGVTFTAEQEAQVKALQESGDLMGAQMIILDELQKEFGGSAKAAGETFGGQLTILQNKLGNIRESIGMKLMPSLTQLADTFTNYLMRPEVLLFIENLGLEIAEFAQKVVEGVPVVIEWLMKIPQWLEQNRPIVVGILAALGVAIAAFVYTTVIPALVAFITAAAPVILIMAAIGLAAYLLYRAWTENWGGIQEKTKVVTDFVSKSIQGWKLLFTVTIPNAIATLKQKWTAGFEGIRSAIQKVIDFAQKLRDKLMSVTLPDWLTPGSPTPFEIGLLGIADALNKVEQHGLPNFSPQAPTLPTATTGRLGNGSTTEKTVVNNITVNNPKKETAEKTVRQELKKLSYVGVPA